MRNLGVCKLPPLFSEGLNQLSSFSSSSSAAHEKGLFSQYHYRPSYYFTAGMDLDLSQPCGERLNKDEDTQNGVNMLHGHMKLHNDDLEAEDGGNAISFTADVPEPEEYKEVINLEPLPGMEFSSHEEAYAFYREYARSMGFNTAIQNSRRSKTTKDFIDAKFACSKYGSRRESDKSVNRPRSRQVKLDPENQRRVCSKTGCKASMHVKRRPDGKWIIHSFVKEHNHELLPAQAVNEQTQQMYAVMARQYVEYKNLAVKTDSKNSDNGRKLPLEGGDIKILLESASTRPQLKKSLLEDRYDEESKADSDTWNKPAVIKSPSPFEKILANMYTNAVFKKAQYEVLGASYNSAIRALEEAFGNCVSLNTSDKNLLEGVTSPTHGLIGIEDDNQSRSMSKGAKKRNLPKKRKGNSEQEVMAAVGAQDSLQQMEKLTSRPVSMDTYYSAQQSGPGMLNLMDSHRDNYYGSQQTMSSLGQLNSLTPNHGAYCTPQQSMSGMGQLDFLRASAGYTYGMRDDSNIRTSQLHGESSRHGLVEARMMLYHVEGGENVGRKRISTFIQCLVDAELKNLDDLLKL
ncbi:hypothetical protein ACFE04_031766 [Oxalis oulophora]